MWLSALPCTFIAIRSVPNDRPSSSASAAVPVISCTAGCGLSADAGVLDRRRERHRPAQPDLAGGGQGCPRRQVVQSAPPVGRVPGQPGAQLTVEVAELGLGHRLLVRSGPRPALPGIHFISLTCAGPGRHHPGRVGHAGTRQRRARDRKQSRAPVRSGAALPERGPMPRERLVAVSYPVDDEYAKINADVLAGEATVAFLRQVPEPDRAAVLARADALIGWNLARELPEGALHEAPDLGFIQLLSAGADSIDFRAIPESDAAGWQRRRLRQADGRARRGHDPGTGQAPAAAATPRWPGASSTRQSRC